MVGFDGWAYHSDRGAFEHDRLRDQTFAAAGIRPARVTTRQLDGAPHATIARLAGALAVGIGNPELSDG